MGRDSVAIRTRANDDASDGQLMATHHVVKINIPMAEALKRMLIRNECPRCMDEIELHSEITLTSSGVVVSCSNAR